MKPMTNVQLAGAIVNDLNRRSANDAAMLLMVGLVARIVTGIDEGRWREMLLSAEVPCDVEGCDCEKSRMKFYGALDELRTEYLEQEAKRGGHG